MEQIDFRKVLLYELLEDFDICSVINICQQFNVMNIDSQIGLFKKSKKYNFHQIIENDKTIAFIEKYGLYISTIVWSSDEICMFSDGSSLYAEKCNIMFDNYSEPIVISFTKFISIYRMILKTLYNSEQRVNKRIHYLEKRYSKMEVS